MKYKTIFIDWHGTLSNSRFWERWANDKAKQHLHELAQHALFEDVEGLRMLKRWMRGFCTAHTIIEYLHNTTGISESELEDELRYTAENMVFINPDVMDRVETLRSMGIKVVIASDNMDTFKRWTVPALGLNDMFDEILTSEQQGALKTDINTDGFSQFFGHYLQQHGLRSGETVLIDDSEDLKLVKNLGIDFLHVNKSTDLTHHLDDLIQSAK